MQMLFILFRVQNSMKSGDMTDFCPSCGAYIGKGEPNATN